MKWCYQKNSTSLKRQIESIYISFECRLHPIFQTGVSISNFEYKLHSISILLSYSLLRKIRLDFTDFRLSCSFSINFALLDYLIIADFVSLCKMLMSCTICVLIYYNVPLSHWVHSNHMQTAKIKFVNNFKNDSMKPYLIYLFSKFSTKVRSYIRNTVRGKKQEYYTFVHATCS